MKKIKLTDVGNAVIIFDKENKSVLIEKELIPQLITKLGNFCRVNDEGELELDKGR